MKSTKVLNFIIRTILRLRQSCDRFLDRPDSIHLSFMSLFFSSGKKAGTSEVFSPPSPPEYDLNSTMVDPIFDYQFRVILIGDSTVGKSSLLRHFTDGTFAEVSDPTVGVDFFARLLRVRDGTTIKLQLWDTAGQVKAV